MENKKLHRKRELAMKKQKSALILMITVLLFSSCSTHQPGISLKGCLGYDIKKEMNRSVGISNSAYHSSIRGISWVRISFFFEIPYTPSSFNCDTFYDENDIDYTYSFLIFEKNTTKIHDFIYIYQEKIYVWDRDKDLVYESIESIDVEILENEFNRKFSVEQWAQASKKERKTLIYLFVDTHFIYGLTYEELKTYLGPADRLEKKKSGTNAYYFFPSEEASSSYFKVYFEGNNDIDSYELK